jgi:REP element-mobilizing transposase RayT
MPVYLFTYHGYATWMPDRPQGYVHHTRGLQQRDEHIAAAYRRNQRESTAIFDEHVQRIIIDAALQTQQHLDIIVHAVSTEPTHAHVLLSWSHERDWLSLRESIKTAISRALSAKVAKRTWLCKNASRKHIRDQRHFDHHMFRYFPKHAGVKWFHEQDIKAARRRAAQ